MTGSDFSGDTAPKWVVDTEFGMTAGARRIVEGGKYYWRMNQWLYRFLYDDRAGARQSWTVRMWVPADDGICNIICVTYNNQR